MREQVARLEAKNRSLLEELAQAKVVSEIDLVELDELEELEASEKVESLEEYGTAPF